MDSPLEKYRQPIENVVQSLQLPRQVWRTLLHLNQDELCFLNQDTYFQNLVRWRF